MYIFASVITRAGILISGCSPCTTAFRLCLKEYQTTEQGASISTGCSFGNATTKILGGSSFVLSDPGVGAIVLPFTFRWTVSARSHKYSFYIIAYMYIPIHVTPLQPRRTLSARALSLCGQLSLLFFFRLKIARFRLESSQAELNAPWAIRSSRQQKCE